MGKVLSIVVPTYNMEKYLDRCLSSFVVGTSSMNLLEVLVINDGSKDNSSDIAHGYESRFPGVFRVIDKENGNYGSCINKGLSLATGKYIKIVDADDWVDTIALGSLLYRLQEHDVDLVVTNFNVVNDSRETIETWRYELPVNKTITICDLLPEIINRMKMHAVIYKTEILRGLEYHQTEGISYTDQEWIFYPFSSVNTIMFFDLFLYQYLIGRDGQTIDPRSLKKNIHHNIIILRRMLVFDRHNYSDTPGAIYRRQRIKSYSDYIYDLYLYHPSMFDLSGLHDLDNEIRENDKWLYDYINDRRRHCIWILMLWRKYGITSALKGYGYFYDKKYRYCHRLFRYLKNRKAA